MSTRISLLFAKGVPGKVGMRTKRTRGMQGILARSMCLRPFSCVLRSLRINVILRWTEQRVHIFISYIVVDPVEFRYLISLPNAGTETIRERAGILRHLCPGMKLIVRF